MIETIAALYRKNLVAMREAAVSRVHLARVAVAREFNADETMPVSAVLSMLEMTEEAIRNIEIK
jgi:hypothetical protein